MRVASTGMKTLVAGLRSRLQSKRELEARLAEKNETLQRVRRRAANRERELTRLREELTQAKAASHSRGFSSGSIPAFFLIGRARSGTTWLRSVLNFHPEIMCWGEGRFFERSFERGDFEGLRSKNMPSSSLYRAILQSRLLRAWIDESVWARGKETDEHLVGLTRLAVDYFLTGQLSKTNKRIVGDKTPFVSAEIVEEISTIYPEARVIHIIRDGRDVAVSLMHHMWNNAKNEGGVYDLEPEELEKRYAYRAGTLVPPADSLFTKERLIRIATDWRAEVGKATEEGPALLGSNYTEVRYEDLLERPVEEIRRLIEFLGAADSSEEVARRCTEKAGFERHTSRKRGQEDSSSRYRKGVAGDWRNVFTEEDQRTFMEFAGDMLVELGYEKGD
jgi:sulfotransferase family protein